MAGEPVWPDWGEFITQDREHINQLRGLRSPQQQTQPTQRMGEPDMEMTEIELAEMAETSWRDLNASQQRMVLVYLCGAGRSPARTDLRRALNMNPERTAVELWEVQQTAGSTPASDAQDTPVSTMASPAVAAQPAPQPTPIADVDWVQQWQPGMLVDELPADLHAPRRVVTDAQLAADKARANPGRWAVYSANDGEHARRVALDKVRRVKRADVQAFAPAGAFDAAAIEVEPGRYVVYCNYVGGPR